MNSETINTILASMAEINELLIVQANERKVLMDEILHQKEKLETRIRTYSDAVDLVHDNIDSLNTTLTDLSIQEIKDDPIYKLCKKVENINSVIGKLDLLQEKKLELEIKNQELNKKTDDRDELIAILSDYVQLEQASNYKLLGEINDLEDRIEAYKQDIDVHNNLSRFDPRLRALKIIETHPQGISKHQLVKMLDVSNYESFKILNDLKQLNLILMSDVSDIIHVGENHVELQLTQTI
ncbi:MAG: hypothetical protein INQ03_01795 [Candidatus Heimdallarchaeota archaeon]|nr:hypothetical protein [Candidatus Heimdallarchaeota archaeon]